LPRIKDDLEKVVHAQWKDVAMIDRLETAQPYRRLLAFATIGPIVAAIVAYDLGWKDSWPVPGFVAIAVAAWVVVDASRRDDPYRRLWYALAALPLGFWGLGLVLTLFP
jgi:hypothetical protein